MANRRTYKPWWAALISSAVVTYVWASVALCVARGDTSLNEKAAETAEQASAIDFARDVQPILASKCIRCHGPETHEAGLRLDDRNVAISRARIGQPCDRPWATGSQRTTPANNGRRIGADASGGTAA